MSFWVGGISWTHFSKNKDQVVGKKGCPKYDLMIPRACLTEIIQENGFPLPDKAIL